MNCYKCGTQIEDGQVFCPKCLEGMEKYPVKPNTVIHLPPRREESQSRKQSSRRKKPTPEEREARLKRRLRSLSILLAAMVLVTAALVGAVVRLAREQHKPLPGQNYSIATTAPQESTP